ncbi:MAG: TlpA family protein disulfide reductase [Phycisphaerae bacterium]|nr:TlpA family protein disulfide reductase [Phycisphaerae bacterium]
MRTNLTRACLMAVVVGTLCGTTAAGQQALGVGQEFPTFSGDDFMTKEPIDFAKFRGKVMIVEFWGTWCPPCRAAVPHIRELYEKQHESGLDIISIANERQQGNLKPFIEKEKMTWHHIQDERDQLTRKYGIRGFPTAFVIDRDGILVWTGHPMDGMDKVVEETLKKPWAGAEEAEAKAKPELEKADALRDEGKAKEAAEAYKAIVDNYAGTPSAKEAQKQFDKLDSDPAVRKARAAKASSSECDRWLKFARNMKEAERYDMARKYYQKIIDKHADSEEAQTAKEEIAELPKE